MDISERIKKLREIYGITSNELADITGIHPVSIRKYETKKMVPGIDVIDKMCEALKLPRMIFEGIPAQYTNYNFEGDFYQVLALLLANNTLNVEGRYNPNDESKDNTHFSINPDLSKYIVIKNGNDEIPIENIHIEPSDKLTGLMGSFRNFEFYLDYLCHAEKASESKRWNSKRQGETKEEYADRMRELAETELFKAMLVGHNWEQHMSGDLSKDALMSGLDKCILAGGNYYTFIMQLDIPESVKQKYIESYENAYVEEIVRETCGEYSPNASFEDKMEWAHRFHEVVQKYKNEHPNYKEDAKQHAIDVAANARKDSK